MQEEGPLSHSLLVGDTMAMAQMVPDERGMVLNVDDKLKGQKITVSYGMHGSNSIHATIKGGDD